MEKPAFQQNIHVFRGVAILLIIGAHTIPSLHWGDHPLLEEVLDTICNEASVLFFFIAGYLFQHLSYNFDARKYFRNKFNNVLIPYFLVSLPALYIFTVLVERDDMYAGFYDEPLAFQLFFFLLTGKHLAPLWFVPTITLFYLLGPVLVRLDKLKPFYYCLPVLLLVAVDHGRGGTLGPIDKAIYLAPAYLFGMAFSHYRSFWVAFTRKYWALFAAAAAALFGLLMIDLPAPPYLQLPFKLSVAPLLVVGLYHASGFVGHRLDYIAEISFGLFFVHAYVIAFLKLAYTYVVSERLYDGTNAALLSGNLFTFGLYHVLVTLISVAIIWLAQEFFGRRSRLLVGA